jgi:hypothetical protein
MSLSCIYNLELLVPGYRPCQYCNNKLSLVGMQLSEKYKENFDVSSEGPSSGVSSLLTSNKGPSLEMSKFSLYFLGSCIPIPTKACS